eukprot:442566-Rhodomonas_salina.2
MRVTRSLPRLPSWRTTEMQYRNPGQTGCGQVGPVDTTLRPYADLSSSVVMMPARGFRECCSCLSGDGWDRWAVLGSYAYALKLLRTNWAPMLLSGPCKVYQTS